jgi:hypothetical protein
MVARRGAYWVAVEKHEGNRQLGRPWRRWIIIFKWIFRMWVGDMDWIDLAQDRDRWWVLVNAVMNLRVA